jgi:hypothetical protein
MIDILYKEDSEDDSLMIVDIGKIDKIDKIEIGIDISFYEDSDIILL